MNLFSRLLLNKELKARRETLVLLRAKSDRQLLDCGISPELLEEGVKAWPWRVPPEEPNTLLLTLTKLSSDTFKLPVTNSAKVIESDTTTKTLDAA